MNLLGCLNVTAELGTINRYSKSRLANQESVLEHTGFVSMICYFIGESCNEHVPDSIDMGLLLSKCVMHDVEEFVSGDVQRPTKRSSAEMSQCFEKFSAECADVVKKETGVNSVSQHWEKSKTGKEGSIVEFADTFSVVYKAYDEVYMRGNRTLQFGGVDGLRKLIRKRLSGMEMHGIPEPVTRDFFFQCQSLLGRIDEVLR